MMKYIEELNEALSLIVQKEKIIIKDKELCVENVSNKARISVYIELDEATIAFADYHTHIGIDNVKDCYKIVSFIQLLIEEKTVILSGTKKYSEGVICCPVEEVNKYMIEKSAITSWNGTYNKK